VYSTPNIIRILEDEMGGACGMNGRDKKCMQSFGQKTTATNQENKSNKNVSV
jgi:hypothetical protein